MEGSVQFYPQDDTTAANINAANTTAANATDETIDYRWSFEFSVILATILSVAAFFIIVGNSMVLVVIIRHRGMRTRTNLFLVNLAVADLFVGLFVVPFTITTLVENDWIFGEGFVCKFNGWMNSFCLISSIHTLMYISIHKYYSIVRPLSNPLKLSYIIAMMAAAWIWAGACSTMNIIGLKVEYKPGTSQCGPKYPDGLQAYIIHALLQITVILIPLIILVFCYTRMFQAIKKHSQRLRNNSTVAEDLILSQQKKVAVTLLIVLATFVIMALPYHAYANYTTIIKDKKHFSSYLNPVAYTFLFLSSMCNPIIYAFRSPAFREGYKEILCQTPNYVISDDSEVTPRTNRLSSLISTIRRGSSISSGHRNTVTSMYDVNIEPVSPQEAGSKIKRSKQKSLFNLLRSTRQSNAQSVVHRNGDIIIMKGGKIVSVRRGIIAREENPFLDRLQKLKAEAANPSKGLAAGLATPGDVLCGLVCEPLSESPTVNLKIKEQDETSSVGSDDVFSGTELDGGSAGGLKNELYSSNGNTNSAKKPHNKKNQSVDLTGSKDKPGQRLKQDLGATGSSNSEVNNISDQSSLQTTSNSVISCNAQSLSQNGSKFRSKSSNDNLHKNVVDRDFNSNRSNKNSKKNHSLQSSQQSSFDFSNDIESEKSTGVVINISENDEVLSVMPLTPNTREYLTKSDFHLDQSDTSSVSHGHRLQLGRANQASHSTDNLAKKPHQMLRLPSVEYLDPPVHIFRSRSNVCIGSGADHARKITKARSRSRSPELRTHSKSPNLRSVSPFRRKYVPDQNTPL
ncbi:unnamed protein product [Lymnaea stagnalis]|uniref:G-protein coupled receptors family 1 profile domain-containing protein n=1 Tax=Lymnaea stagnalis TaxID=6523 RepID=A0AAV2HB31_LYMST